MALIESFYYKFALGIASYPKTVIFICLFTCLIISSGLLLIDFENDPQKLWVASDSETNYQQLYFNEKFGSFYRINQIILRARDKSKKIDIFQKVYLEEIYEIQSEMEKSNFEYKSKTYSVDDLCFKPIAGKGCMTTSPMDFWKMDIQKMREDADIKETAKCLVRGDIEQQELPCFDRNGIPIVLEAVFGNQKCMDGEVKNECTLCKQEAKALVVTFLLNNDYYMNSISAEWEKVIFEKIVNKYNEKKEEYFKGKGMEYLIMDRLTERSIPDQLEEMNAQNIGVVIISYVVMFVYISLCMGEFSLVKSRILLALGGIFLVVISFLCSVSIVSMMGIKLSLISAEVVPFLVLAIGVDNMFIITGTKDRISRLYKIIKIPKLIAISMAEAGPSITVASLCEFLAFIVGYLTKIPALQSFCITAAFAVLIDFVLQITLFISLVSLDEERSSNGYMDVIFCYKVKNPPLETQEQEFIDSDVNEQSDSGIKENTIQEKDYVHYVKSSESENEIKDLREKPRKTPKKPYSEKIITAYMKILYTKPFIIISLIIYLFLIVMSILACIFLPLGLDQRVSVIEGSKIYEYFNSQAEFIDVGPPAYLVFDNIDYNNKENLELMDQINNNIARLSTVVPPVFSWYKDFSTFIETLCDESDKYSYVLTLPFDVQVREFLKISTDDKCCKRNGICGEPYMMDLSFDDEGKLDSTRFRFQHIALVNQTVFIDSLLETKNLLKKYTEKLKKITGKNGKSPVFKVNDQIIEIDSTYPYSLFYVYFDQYLVIRGVLIENWFIALAVIFLATQIIVPVKSAFIITIFVFSTIFNLLGMLYITNIFPGFGVEINAVSVVNIVMACGLCVEFIVHTVIFYLKKRKGTFLDKTMYSMKTVGTSVFIGIITTKFIGKYFIIL